MNKANSNQAVGMARAVAWVTAVLFTMITQAGAQEAARETTGALSQGVSTTLTEESGAENDQAQASPSSPDIVLVTNRPIEVRSGSSSSASLLYGFPAGRPVRLIGRNAGFAQIQDLHSGATGWIDEAALAQPVEVTPSPPSTSKIAPRNDGTATAVAEQDRRTPGKDPGSIRTKRGGNLSPNRQRPLAGFFGGLFSSR
jgi:hypothetical protein